MLEFVHASSEEVAGRTRHVGPKVPRHLLREHEMAGFLAKYDPEIQQLAEACLVKMRARYPGAVEMIYDNYNALVSGFSPTERPSDAVFSIVLFPRYVSLCFLQGVNVEDPDKLLQGSGNQVRSIRLNKSDDLDDPSVQDLMKRAAATAKVPLNGSGPVRMVIRSISAKQRPRRPSR